MQCDWEAKTLTFSHNGQQIQLKGLTAPPLQATPMTANQLYKASQGNDT